MYFYDHAAYGQKNFFIYLHISDNLEWTNFEWVEF